MKEDIFIPEHKTRVLPLRWLANYVFHPVSMWFFNIGLRANDRYTYEWDTYKFRHFLMEKFGYWMYYYLDKPYQWWGTVYVFDSSILKELKEETKGSNWDDYDDSGHAYWEYFWQQGDDGDAFRLIPYWQKEKNEN